MPISEITFVATPNDEGADLYQVFDQEGNLVGQVEAEGDECVVERLSDGARFPFCLAGVGIESASATIISILNNNLERVKELECLP